MTRATRAAPLTRAALAQPAPLRAQGQRGDERAAPAAAQLAGAPLPSLGLLSLSLPPFALKGSAATSALHLQLLNSLVCPSHARPEARRSPHSGCSRSACPPSR